MSDRRVDVKMTFFEKLQITKKKQVHILGISIKSLWISAIASGRSFLKRKFQASALNPLKIQTKQMQVLQANRIEFAPIKFPSSGNVDRQ